MKICPNCKAQLDDSARFCLQCMTSLEEKEQIQPPVLEKRRWPLVLLCCLLLGTTLTLLALPKPDPQAEPPAQAQTSPQVPANAVSCTVDGVLYTFRPAAREEHPSALTLDNYYTLIRVEGVPADGIYRVPSFVGEDTDSLVTAVADGAFAGTNARAIDLGHNVRYVWGDAFGGNSLTDLYLHEDVYIGQSTFSCCKEELTVHCPDFLENTEGLRWAELAVRYGFRWNPTQI